MNENMRTGTSPRIQIGCPCGAVLILAAAQSVEEEVALAFVHSHARHGDIEIPDMIRRHIEGRIRASERFFADDAVHWTSVNGTNPLPIEQ